MLHEVIRTRVLCVAAVALVLAGGSKAIMEVMALEEAYTMLRASRVARRAWGLVTMMTIGETVQAVVAAVTAATKAAEPSAVSVSHAAVVADDMGVATDIRSDYLSLRGVGTLFGKTLDVDMAYTRNNRVLRTKIGCLDRNLIPADSDVFIRRGFFKLRFEVETTQGSQEVNMAEANNGNDGNDDAHNGEENNGGGNAMDMDPKGVDEGNTSNNNGQEGSYENNGVDGMQVQSNHIDAIQIGTMNVQITPTDMRPKVSTLGLPQVGGVVATAVLPVADSLLRTGQSAQRPTDGVQRTQQPADAALPLADSQQQAMQAGPLPPNGVQGSGQVVGCHMHAGDQALASRQLRSGTEPKAGSWP
ncbi:hypothetical protein QYE76_048955 [Lolium multiflorum]|uniref:Uncharacterized protein n=1 Tax=Lolium multiflorum TaxID=4521 RepID=A0AAD8SM50_LOLMU|nr:hypothetical protein QYE76_048955 [Lolium multiflorum]